MKLLFLCGLLLALDSFTWGAPSENAIHDEVHIVNTKYGPVDGIRENSNSNKNVIAYYGLPYAQPPTGANRFRPPVALEDKVSEEIFHAEHIPSPCYQNPASEQKVLARAYGFYPNRPWSEDCLKLNIWLPSADVKDAPIVVFLHPGGFYMGTAVTAGTNGATLASEEGVIVISVNFRLGVLGFMSLGMDDAPGNMGLMDQQMALKWVHDNIAAFGGDPNAVTLYGVSAGGASVGYQLLAPSSQGLFRRVIIGSGTPTAPWATHSLASVIRKTKKVARTLGYRGPDNAEDFLKYLREQHAEDLVDANEFKTLLSGDVIAPTIDGHFITDNPHHLLDKADTNASVEVMIGTTSSEGSVFLVQKGSHLFRENSGAGLSKEDFGWLISHIDSHGIDKWISGAIVNNYVDYKRIGDPYMYRERAIKAIGDYLFTCDTESFADHLARHGHKVYRYVFDQYIPFTEEWLGAIHGSDIPVVFGQHLNDPRVPKPLHDFIKNIMDQYGNFIRTGDPNADRDEHKLHWPLYNLEDRAVKILRAGNCSVENHPGAYHCAVMRYLVPMVSKIGHCERGEQHHGTDHVKGHHPHHHEE